MSTFYHVLSGYYDTLFPEDPEITGFLAGVFDDGAGASPYGSRGPVIDAACGTGTYTDALVRRGIPCVGFDADPAMVALARSGDRHGLVVPGTLQSMRETVRSLTGDKYRNVPPRGIFCIGNSLPHLPNDSAVDRFFRDARMILESDGAPLVVQVINFARFLSSRAAALPSIERPDVTMRRRYRPSGTPGKVVFEAELIPRDRPAVRSETELLALNTERLERISTDAGFNEPILFGGYDGSPYDRETSFVIILVAR